MDLSTEVKGYIQDAVPTKIYSWAKITTFGRRIGIETAGLDTKKMNKREVVEYFMNNVPRNSGEVVLSTLISMSKKGMWDSNYSKEIVAEINPILERTMNCRIDENDKVTMLFPLLEQEPDLIATKLSDLGFIHSFANYEQAVKTYRTSPKGCLSLLRTTIESLVEELIKAKGLTPATNHKDRLAQIAALGITKTISTTDCTTCHYKKLDNEFNLSYDLYGLLSHYGSHGGLVDDPMVNFLFTSTSAYIWLIINRFDALP
jgi:hypothetical protein